MAKVHGTPSTLVHGSSGLVFRMVFASSKVTLISRAIWPVRNAVNLVEGSGMISALTSSR